MAAFKDKVSSLYKEIQDDICFALQQADGKAVFEEDIWHREGGGGGRTRVIQDGQVFEKAGVNYSAVFGALPNQIARKLDLSASTFYATGVSIVIHPQNPWVPIIHMNIRYFEMQDGTFWFGGGIDLTPIYIDKQQAQFFHASLKKVCDEFDAAYYERFKKWADAYFYIPHRGESRGIGGIFYDRLGKEEKLNKEQLLAFSVALGRSFAPIYLELVQKNKNISYSKENLQWQHLRRGRYVEFNLVYDKGTKFGLETGGRVESILMSLPKNASWLYDYKTKSGSKEEATLNLLQRPEVDWLLG